HNALTAIVLKAHPSSRGVVRLTGSHPQDPLRIEKRHFEAPGGPADITSMREAIKAAWALAASLNITMHVEKRVFPEPQVQSDEQIEDHILQNVLVSHHACCTNPMGADDDLNAVLDGNFKVRGVDNLRVVDISSWPTIPGFFVTTPRIWLISEKAADVI
ncbi:glucose-methanol-choline oxidoreductase, partial [Mycena olivaceomarginata]